MAGAARDSHHSAAGQARSVSGEQPCGASNPRTPRAKAAVDTAALWRKWANVRAKVLAIACAPPSRLRCLMTRLQHNQYTASASSTSDARSCAGGR